MENKRNTKQKQMILEFLEKNKNKHLSINEIVIGLDNKIGTTTIYRKINDLIDEGMINKIPLNNSQGYCYQYAPKTEACKNHYHLVCQSCEKLTHFDSDILLNVIEEASEKENFEIDIPKIVFYGICKDCRKNS